MSDASIKEDLAELKQDVKDIRSSVTDIAVNTAKNTVSLDTHISRTALAEKRIEKLEYWLIGILGTALVAIILKLLFS